MYRPVPRDPEHRNPITDPSWRNVVLTGVTVVLAAFVFTVLIASPKVTLGIVGGIALQYSTRKANRIARSRTARHRAGTTRTEGTRQ